MKGNKAQIRAILIHWRQVERRHAAAEKRLCEQVQGWLSKEALHSIVYGATGESDLPWAKNERKWLKRETVYKEEVETLWRFLEEKLDGPENELPEWIEVRNTFWERKEHLEVRKQLRLRKEAWYCGREAILDTGNLQSEQSRLTQMCLQNDNAELLTNTRKLESKVLKGQRKERDLETQLKNVKDCLDIRQREWEEDRQRLEETQRNLLQENTKLQEENLALRQRNQQIKTEKQCLNKDAVMESLKAEIQRMVNEIRIREQQRREAESQHNEEMCRLRALLDGAQKDVERLQEEAASEERNLAKSDDTNGLRTEDEARQQLEEMVREFCHENKKLEEERDSWRDTFFESEESFHKQRQEWLQMEELQMQTLQMCQEEMSVMMQMEQALHQSNEGLQQKCLELEERLSKQQQDTKNHEKAVIEKEERYEQLWHDDERHELATKEKELCLQSAALKRDHEVLRERYFEPDNQRQSMVQESAEKAIEALEKLCHLQQRCQIKDASLIKNLEWEKLQRDQLFRTLMEQQCQETLHTQVEYENKLLESAQRERDLSHKLLDLERAMQEAAWTSKPIETPQVQDDQAAPQPSAPKPKRKALKKLQTAFTSLFSRQHSSCRE